MAARQKLILIDGNSLANRAFYALPPFSTAAGVFTNAVYGFLNMLYRLLDEERPDYVIVAFDMGGPTFRDEMYSEYKATRQAPPDQFRPQLGLLREVLRALNIPYTERAGFEADDLLGTLSRLAAESGLGTIIVTGDRDALQLVDDQVTVYMTRKGISEVVRYDPAQVRETMGLKPQQIIDLKALMGDASDNIPGVPGVGEKTALKLVQQFGSVEAVLAAVDQVSGPKLQQALRTHAGDAELSKRLATIDRAVPVELDLAAARLGPPDYATALPLFKRLEFKTLLGRVTPPAAALSPVGPEDRDASAPSVARAGGAVTVGAAAVGTDLSLHVVDTAAAAQPLACQLPYHLSVVLQLETVSADAAGSAGRSRPIGMALMAAEQAPVPGGQAPAAAGQAWWIGGPAISALDNCWAGRSLVGSDVKPLLTWLHRRGLPAPVVAFDAALAGYVLDPGRSTYRLPDLARQFGLGDVPDGPSPREQAARAAALAALQAPMTAELQEAGLWPLYAEVELPALAALAELEAAGIKVDAAQLETLALELDRRIQQVTADIYGAVGYGFNINSPKQLGEVLFTRLGLPVIKRTKTGPSTDADVLEELATLHPAVARILDFRTLVKLKGTYVDGLRELIEPDGKVHTTFNQTVAATGRLSSTDPNLQNIPIRIEEGRRLRKVFVPSQPDWLLVAVDYSQIELRVVAHYSGDPSLLEAFRCDEDVHTRTAAEVFGVPIKEVGTDQRRAAKAVNFGLVYGQSEFGLARSIGVGRAEARDFIQRYFALYPGVKAYMDAKVAEARQKGFVTTLMGRRRFLPEINQRVYALRQRAEREAINTPIQGTAADMMKVAMVRVHRALAESRLQARMLLQVHDELVFEAPVVDVIPLCQLVVREMEAAMPLAVPLKTEAKVGSDWYSMVPVAEWLATGDGARHA